MVFKKGHLPWNTGIKMSEELRQQLSKAHIGLISPKKGKSDVIKKCVICRIKFKVVKSNKRFTCCSKICRLERCRQRMIGNKYKVGKKQSKEHIQKRVEQTSGENHWNWKGGKTPLNKRLRCSSKWKIWRELIFLRDNFTCQNKNCKYCNNKIGVMLHPHHIKPLALHPELVFEVDNGITYCAEFHLNSKLHLTIREELMQRGE